MHNYTLWTFEFSYCSGDLPNKVCVVAEKCSTAWVKVAKIAGCYEQAVESIKYIGSAEFRSL